MSTAALAAVSMVRDAVGADREQLVTKSDLDGLGACAVGNDAIID